MDGRVALLGLRQRELAEWLSSLGERSPSMRAEQLFAQLYRHAAVGADVADMTAVSGAFRARLAALADASGDLTLSHVASAADGTRKLVFRLADAAGGSVEAVVIPAPGGGRTTLCVSSQLGACCCVRARR